MAGSCPIEEPATLARNNATFDISFYFRDYFSPSLYTLLEKKLTWEYTFVSFVQHCLGGGGGGAMT